ncbi:MAG: hypothetical protein QHI38_07195 [Armatimonadota bacterium]|nr:hypothetical protein [Armatimonadota bacterium]
MRLLSDVERSAAAGDVRELITSSGQTATLLRKQAGENLYSSDEGEFAEVCTFALEFVATPPVDIAKRADALACVPPELDVRVEDRVHIHGRDFRVQTVSPQSLFGVVTHKVLELVALHGC